MKPTLTSLLFAICLPLSLWAQSQEISTATGLPIPIGAPVIFGQVVIRNMPKNERRPNISVSLRVSGTQVDKYRISDSGYWYFLRRPEDGMLLVFELDGNELGQATIIGSFSTRFRQDVEFDWHALNGSQRSATGVISARDRYPRDKDREKEYEKAFAAFQSGNSAEALRLFDAILRNDPKDYNAWMIVGTIHDSNKKPDEARKAFGNAIQLKPDYLMANLNLGKLELGQKNFDAALVALGKAVEVEPNSAEANHMLGELLLQMKKGSLAVKFLQKAIELAPIAKADVHLRLAALYHAAGYKDLASSEYQAFLEKVKDHPERKKLEEYIKQHPPKK